MNCKSIKFYSQWNLVNIMSKHVLILFCWGGVIQNFRATKYSQKVVLGKCTILKHLLVLKTLCKRLRNEETSCWRSLRFKLVQ